MGRYIVHTRALHTGTHDPATYIALVFALLRARRSGILEIQSGGICRRLFLLDGEPVWYDSDNPQESLQATLVECGLLEEHRAERLQKLLAAGESFRDSVLTSGAISHEQLVTHEQRMVAIGYAASLASSDGEWTFECCDDLHGVDIDPDLRMSVSPLAALWQGVRWHISDEVATGLAAQTAERQLRAGPDLKPCFHMLEVEGVIAALPLLLEEERTVEELADQFTDAEADLARLLWLLDLSGLTDGEGLGIVVAQSMEWAYIDESSIDRLVAFESWDPESVSKAPSSDDYEFSISED